MFVIQALKEQKSNFHQIRGLVLTGWQRYDHLATLCELLPAAIPSLILNLITVTSGQFDPSAVWNKFNQVLDCSSNSFYQQHLERNRAAHAGDNTVTTSSYLESDPFLYQRASTCHFPGVEIFRLTKSLGELVKKVDAYVYDVNVHRAWLTDYNFRRNYTNPARVEEQIPDASDLLRQIEYLMSDTKDRMAEVYDMYTISEWIEQNIYPYLLKVKRIQEEANRVSLVRQWQVRPLTPLKDLQNLFSKP